MKRTSVVLVCLFLVLGFFSTAIAKDTSQGVIELVFSSPWPPPPSNMGAAIDRFMTELEKQSNGRVKFKRHWGGSMSTGHECFEAIKKGFIDLGALCWLYQPGLTPIGMLPFAVPFKSKDPWIENQCIRHTYNKFPAFQDEVQGNNIVPVVWYTMLPATLFTKFQVNSLEDVKGRKLGAGGTHFPKYVKAVGAVGVNILAAETYTALERNVIEGHLIPLDVVDDQKVYEVVEYATEAVFSPITCNLWGFNSRSFKRLPKDIQQMALKIGDEMNLWTCEMVKAREKEIKKKWLKHGIKFGVLSDADKKEWLKAMYYIPGEWAEAMESKGLPGWEMPEFYCQCMVDKGHEFPSDWELSKKFKK